MTSRRDDSLVNDSQFAEVFASCLEVRERGETIDADRLRREHPDHAEAVLSFFADRSHLDDMRDPAEEDSTPTETFPASRPTQLGDFRILREVGRGGMGVVYEAEQVSLGRRVAIKVLPHRLLGGEQQRRRFEREVRATARLHHTNVVPVFGVGRQDGLDYYVMQFIDGRGLDGVMSDLRRRLRDDVTVRIGGSSTTRQVTLTDTTESAAARTWSLPAAVVHSQQQNAITRTAAYGSMRDSDGSPVAAIPGLPGDTAVGQLSDTRQGADPGRLRRPGATDLHTTSRLHYCESVARIGVQVAEALQYIHEQGIVHRDVKPSNLILDAGGVVWLTDFGLAKDDDQQNLTQTGDVLGTLRYMAPEQFTGTSDARSDLYSLGLTLYELLVLRPAFDAADRKRLVEQMTAGTPPRLRTIDPSVPRDLETIIHKAIDREPSHRYPTAGDLADDLGRFLRDEPIRAKWVSPLTRLRRWCRRNPLAALMALLLTVLAIGGPVVAANQLQLRNEASAAADDAREQEAKALRQSQIAQFNEAEAARHKRRAEDNLRQARVAVDRLFTKAAEDLDGKPHMEEIRRELLEDALEFYEGFMQQESDDVSIREETALAALRVGRIKRILGQPEQGLEPGRQAVALFESLHADDPVNLDYERELGEAMRELGISQFFANRLEEAADTTLAAIAHWDDLARRHPTVVSYRSRSAAGHSDLANQLARIPGRLDDARTHSRTSVRLWQELREEFPDRIALQEGEAHARHWMASVLIKAERHQESEQHLRQSVALRRQILERQPGNEVSQHALAHALNYLGAALQRREETEEAEQSLLEAAKILEPLENDYPGIVDYRDHLDQTRTSLANVYFSQGRLEEAETLQRQQLRSMESGRWESLEKTYRVGWSYYNLALLIHQQEHIEEAAALFRESFARFDQTLQDAAPDSSLRTRAMNALRWNLETCPLVQFRDPQRALDLSHRLLQSDPLSADLWTSVGIAHYRLKHGNEALAALRKSHEMHAELPASLLYFLAMTHHRLGRLDEAKGWYEQAVELHRKKRWSTSPDEANFHREASELLGLPLKPSAASAVAPKVDALPKAPVEPPTDGQPAKSDSPMP